MSLRSFRAVVLLVSLLAPCFFPVAAASETALFYRPTRSDDPFHVRLSSPVRTNGTIRPAGSLTATENGLFLERTRPSRS